MSWTDPPAKRLNDCDSRLIEGGNVWRLNWRLNRGPVDKAPAAFKGCALAICCMELLERVKGTLLSFFLSVENS